MDLGRYEEAEALLEAKEEGDLEAQARFHATRLRLLMETGRLEEALAEGEAAYRETPHPWLAAALLTAWTLKGRLQEHLLEEARKHQDGRGLALLALAHHRWLWGQNPKPFLKEALREARRLSNPYVHHLALTSLALYHWPQSPQKARVLSQHLLYQTHRTGFLVHLEVARLLRAQLLLEEGERVDHLLASPPRCPSRPPGRRPWRGKNPLTSGGTVCWEGGSASFGVGGGEHGRGGHRGHQTPPLPEGGGFPLRGPQTGGPRALEGALPLSPGEDPLLLRGRGEGPLPLLRLQGRGRPHRLRGEDRGPGLPGRLGAPGGGGRGGTRKAGRPRAPQRAFAGPQAGPGLLPRGACRPSGGPGVPGGAGPHPGKPLPLWPGLRPPQGGRPPRLPRPPWGKPGGGPQGGGTGGTGRALL